MANWKEPKTNYLPSDQVVPRIFNELGENEKYLNETKITIGQVQKAVISSIEALSRDEITKNDTLSVAIGKVRKWFADLKALAFKNTVTTADIDAKAVTTQKLADQAVTDEKIVGVSARKVSGLAEVAKTGDYNDLKNKPGGVDLSGYMKKSDLLNFIYPVGSIKITTDSANPGTYIGGAWEQWGGGRVPIGVGSATDTASKTKKFSSAEATGGEFEHTMTQQEIADHAHYLLEAKQSSISFNASRFGAEIGWGTATKCQMGKTNYGVENVKNNPINIMQPYITCYMWKRTA